MSTRAIAIDRMRPTCQGASSESSEKGEGRLVNTNERKCEARKEKWEKPELSVICEIVVNEDILGSGKLSFGNGESGFVRDDRP